MKFELINKNIQTNPADEVLHIRGLANTGNTDIAGDTLTREALLDICNQATQHNLHIDHDETIDGVLGPITRAELTPEGVEIDADILEGKYTSRIRDLLEHGVRLGMSVRGLAERAGGNFVRVVLTEISLTPLPADQSTLGSVVIVKSFGELARRVVGFDDENLEEDNMADEVITKDVVIELINTGFNERKEEFLETIRNELKDEFGVVLGELKERVEKLEAQGEAPVETEEVDEVESEEVVVEEEPVEEVVLDDNDVVEEEVVAEGPAEEEAPATEEPATEEEATEEEPEEEEETDDDGEDKEEKLKKSIQNIVDQKIEEIFKAHTTEELQFQYQSNGDEQVETVEVKKAYTPRELAEKFF
jgi:hypothetical protein